MVDGEGIVDEDSIRGRVVSLPGEPELMVALSDHCVERFQERFRPGLSLSRSCIELGRLVQVGEVDAVAPAWASIDEAEKPDAVLNIGDDLVLLLKVSCGRLVATTCLGRGTIRPSERRRRKSDRRSTKFANRARKRRHGHSEIPWPDEARTSS